jgi:hypothetical protein
MLTTRHGQRQTHSIQGPEQRVIPAGDNGVLARAGDPLPQEPEEVLQPLQGRRGLRRRAVQARTGLAIRNVIRQLRPLRSATISINGSTQTFPPAINPDRQAILDAIGALSCRTRCPAILLPGTVILN